MIYNRVSQKISPSQRSCINAKILATIDCGTDVITKEEIYNSYTGIGGLHGLNAEDYASFNDYSDAKKEIEKGQFFTPHDICRQMVDAADPSPNDMVLDICCGMGNFLTSCLICTMCTALTLTLLR